MDTLLDMWPPEFERALETLQLPSPDLDLSIAEYARVLCSILDIPTYDNPIESLHLMFTLYMDFRNNPHFQARMAEGKGKDSEVSADGYKEMGGADVMDVDTVGAIGRTIESEGGTCSERMPIELAVPAPRSGKARSSTPASR